MLPGPPPAPEHEAEQVEAVTWSQGVTARLLRNVLLPVAVLLVTFLGLQRHAQRATVLEHAQARLDRTLYATGELLAQRVQHFDTMLQTLLAQEATDELLKHWSAENLQAANLASGSIERSCKRLLADGHGVLAIELHGAGGKLLLSVPGSGEPLSRLDVGAQPWFNAAQRGVDVPTWNPEGTVRIARKRTGQQERDGALIASLVVDLQQLARPAVELAEHAVDNVRLSLHTDSGLLALNPASPDSTDEALSAIAWSAACGVSLQIDQPLDVALAGAGDGGRALTRAHLLLALVLLAALWIGLQQTVLCPLSSIGAMLAAFRDGTPAPLEREHPLDSALLRPVFAIAARVRARWARSSPPAPGPRFDELSDTERVLRVAVDTVQYGDSVLHAQRTALEQQIRERDERLLLQEQNALVSTGARSRFMADLSGQLRAQLDGAHQATGQLLQRITTPEQGQLTQSAHGSAGAALHILAQTEQLGRMEAGQFVLTPRECEIYEALEEIANRAARIADQRGVELTLEIHPEVPRWLAVDPTHLNQLLSTLLDTMVCLSNQGEVVLRVSPVQASEAACALTFEVWGPVGHLDEGALRCALDPFAVCAGALVAPATPMNRPIDDLRLTVCGHLARAMSTEICFRCNPTEGTILGFTATFARLAAEATRPAPSAARPLDRRRILVVDDSSASLRMLATQITACRAIPFFATSAQAAIEMLAESARNEQLFDAALIDLRMPGQDGLALAQWIKSSVEFMDLPLVLMSGGEEQPNVPPFDIPLLAGLLHKPVREADLLRVLDSVIPDGEAAHDEPLAALPRPAVTQEAVVKDWVPDCPTSILLAQAEGTGQHHTAHILRCLGYGLQVVSTGQEALAAIEAEPFHALLIDRELSGPSAYDIAASVRNRADLRSCLPIIGLLPDGTPEERDRCMEAGMDDGVERTVQAKALGALLKRWVAVCSHLSPAELSYIVARGNPNAAQISQGTSPDYS
ncbi:MAG: CheY-like chemotaxis protein [Chlamydiales bacterium]|jgi:CheY-like chemotaxis protein